MRFFFVLHISALFSDFVFRGQKWFFVEILFAFAAGRLSFGSWIELVLERKCNRVMESLVAAHSVGRMKDYRFRRVWACRGKFGVVGEVIAGSLRLFYHSTSIEFLKTGMLPNAPAHLHTS